MKTLEIGEITEKYNDYAIQMRRQFHRYPESAGQEFQTCRMICEELQRMGLEPHIICDTGVTVDIGERSRSGHTACIRADIDALQVQEETGASYASEHEGYMHACGHDAHIAMALTAARILKDREEELNGSVRVIFQPAEETACGARQMIAAGALDQVDTIYGTHVWSGIPAGMFSAEAGSRMASADFFTITIRGKGAHGSMPNKGIDPIAAAAAVIQNVQVSFSREFSPLETALVSFCQIHGGNTDNAIPDTVTIGGTTRAFLPRIRDQFPEIMNRVIRETAAAFRAEACLDYRLGASPLLNDKGASDRAIRAVRRLFGEDAVIEKPHDTGGEDFAEYLKMVPGVFVFLGIENPKEGSVYPNHSSHFAIDESILIKGAAAAVQYCLDFLEEGNDGIF